ncbi:MAG: hypothetical protein IPM39_28150 [Chloroflexi bacterium]|nr:hypothetical protein [Chloroflexota bacterium]
MSGLKFSWGNWRWLKGRGVLVAIILMSALVSFELFNYDTTRFALMDLFSGRRFLGIEWAAILAFAFCGIDFAGLVRMFTPEQTMRDEPREVWLLMGAWLLGASMNAVMTWYAVALAIAPRSVGATLITPSTMLRYAPIFVALLVWLTRILLIGSIAVTTDRLLHQGGRTYTRPRHRPMRENGRQRPMSANGEENYAEDIFNV